MFPTTSLQSPKNERQRNFNDFRPWILQNSRAVWQHWALIELLASSLGKNDFDDFGTMPENWASTEHQQCSALHLGISRGYGITLIHNRTFGRHSRQRCLQTDRSHVPNCTSTKRWRFVSFHLEYYKGNAAKVPHNELIGSRYWQKCWWRYRVDFLQLNTWRASTVFMEAQNATQQWTTLRCS